jgi:hypothetical protein
MAVGAGKEAGRPRHSLTRFLFASHWALRCGGVHRRMPTRLVEVLLEGPHANLRPLLQAELGDDFMVSAGGEPESSEAIILTGSNPERVSMLRQAYPHSGIFVLESSEPVPPAAVGCLTAGANGLLVGRSVPGLGAFVRALVHRLYWLPDAGASGVRGMPTSAFIDGGDEPGNDVN